MELRTNMHIDVGVASINPASVNCQLPLPTFPTRNPTHNLLPRGNSLSQSFRFAIMPFYQVYHSYPLNDLHRRLLAARITTLHCEAFNAPRLLVHVRFFPEHSPDHTYFVGGVSHSSSSNRIVGLVRTSASRSKEEFDKLAEAIEKGWNEILRVDVPKHDGDEWVFKEEEKELMMVAFTPMVTVRERGLTVPEAGNDQAWINSLPIG